MHFRRPSCVIALSLPALSHSVAGRQLHQQGLAREALPRLLDLRRVELDTREEIVCAHLSTLATESRLVHGASGHWNDVIKKRKTLYGAAGEEKHSGTPFALNA
ncbi:hypothetical protein MRX96_046375 [Rhipicephalus microplus]